MKFLVFLLAFMPCFAFAQKIAYLNSPLKPTAGHCSGALTVQSQDSSGKPIIQTAPLTVSFSINFNLISGTSSLPKGFSDSTCKIPIGPLGAAGSAGFGSFGTTTIAKGSSSATIYFIAYTSAFMDMEAVATNYTYGIQTEDVLPGAPVGVAIMGPDTLGVGKCSNVFWVRALDQYSNPANVSSDMPVTLNGLGSSVAYTDPACAIKMVGNKITLKHSTTTFGTYGGPSSDVAFYVKGATGGNFPIIASVTGLPFMYGVNLWITSLANSGKAILPQQHVVIPARPSITGANVTFVAPGTSLQTAIDLASPGDVLVLQADAPYTEPITLTPKTNPNGKYITITSSNLAQLPPQGTRIVPGNDAAKMPHIITSNTSYAFQAVAAVGSTPASSYYRLIGLNVTMDTSITYQYNLLDLASITKGNPVTGASQLPNHILIESSYIHGNATADLQHCITGSAAWVGIVDSYISDCHVVGADAQAYFDRGPGPVKLQNNYLEGAGENVLFGGAPALFYNDVTTDIEILHNTFLKPLAWNPNDPVYFKCVTRKGACAHWTVKNILEFKEGRRILVDGNKFYYNWVDGQTGVAWLITPRADAHDHFIITEDVTYTNNILAHTMQAMSFGRQDTVGPAHGQLTSRVLVENNVMYDIGSPIWGGTTNTNTLYTGGFDGMTFNHNTMGFSNTGSFWGYFMPSPAPTSVSFTNNIATCGLYGFHTSSGDLDSYPNLTMKENAFVACPTAILQSFLNSNYIPATPYAVDFLNYTVDHEFNDSDVLQLKSSSPYYHRLPASDPVGQDLGVNWTTLMSHVQ